MMHLSAEILRAIISQKNAQRANNLSRFFKTGRGEYGEGDKFLGLTVPQARKIFSNYKKAVNLRAIDDLIKNEFHEVRLVALLLLVSMYQKGDLKEKQNLYKFYLSKTKYINNWDLVDLTASKIVGDYLLSQNNIQVLKKLAKSKNIWERRIAIISTFAFIYKGSANESFEISDILIDDKHDLIHKAVGWMLREVGKRISARSLEEYLRDRYKTMPRTMLRYAIEHFGPPVRLKYLKGEI